MYKSYFGFDESPFSITPDPKFIYMSQRHQDALAHLKYGLFETNGFVLLTGEVGTGKTAICRCLLHQLPETVDIAFILNPKQTALELIANICDDLHIEYPINTTSIKVLIDLLNRRLLESYANGRQTILIIDEAQNLSDEVLEQVRLLTNLETPKQKLLQILLVGQPELQSMLARPVLRQLTQRITARFHITALSHVETAAYIRHRMWIAGVQRPIFSKHAIDKVYQLCSGTPRLINIICDRTLLGAYAKNADTIDTKTVIQAAQEILPDTQGGFFNPTRKLIVASIVLASFAVAAYTLPPWNSPDSELLEEEDLFKASTPTTIHKEANTPSVIKTTPTSIIENANTGITLPVNQRKHQALIVASTLTTLKSHKDKITKTIQPKNSQNITTETTSTLKELLNDPDCNSGTETAINSLFNLWGAAYYPQADRTACEVARNVGLSCVHDKGTWNNLRRSNRPAIIELQNSEGNWQHLLLSQLNENDIVLNCGEKSAFITLEQADKHWFGEYLILWSPPKKRMRFERGNKGQDVMLFREQLKTALNIHNTNNSDIFDLTLEKMVIVFQQKHALKADGVAGKDTIIILNTLTNKPGTPLLTTAAR